MSKSIGTVVVMSVLFLGLFYGCARYDSRLTTASFAQNTLTEAPGATNDLMVEGVFAG